MADIPVFVLAGQSNASLPGVDNRIVELAGGGAFEFVKVAVGGTSLFANAAQDWDPASSGELLDLLIAAINSALANVEGQGHTATVRVLWMQGEADAARPAAEYQQKLTDLIAELRAETGQANARIEISLIPVATNVRQAQLAVAASVEDVGTIDPVPHLTFDGVHYSKPTQNMIAEAFMAGQAPPSVPGYVNLLAAPSITYQGATKYVASALYLDFTYADPADTIGQHVNTYSGDDIVTTGAGHDRIHTGGNDDIVRSGAGHDFVDLSLGNDTIWAGAGNDFVLGRQGTDLISGDDGDDTLYGGDQDDRLNGGNGTDTLHGEHGNDKLNGAAGDDTMIGGVGNDEYFVDSLGDSVVETVGQGQDAVLAYVTGYVLPDNVENLRLVGDAQLGTGNELRNFLYANTGPSTLYGLAGNDWLVGREGDDTLVGGVGNDNYTLDVAGSIVVELAGDGYDWLYLAFDGMVLPDNVEGATLTGAALSASGNDARNYLRGNAGDNELAGMGDADTLEGGLGADRLDGGSGNDVLYGGGGNDTLIAGAGFDTLFGDAGTDTALYDLARSEFQATFAGAFLYLRAGGEYDRMTGVEQVQFADGLYAVDYLGAALVPIG